ncbi:enoyl-CoA hydratase/isomerase family protein [Sedimentitalea todarodis]|uniref:Enoyl-CoA hydratase/isomerase family protein n=1 Tax=Sedimentitalea todarodis TaxID=1631240 RepID=A0ABU3VAQ1_9RHOB|nr:enoyl-CoA hydratase/isomerase family protein [Sedimentitalea todarodis]MDU9003255.1 enoyl-CoA hydratase/isomerase family protein [Sedimentitalea todarodis]
MDHLFRTDHGNGVAEITLRRAPVNALSAGFLMDFADLVGDMISDQSVRSVAISSDFKVFSAGLDLIEAQKFDLDAQNAIVKGLNVGFLSLFACPKPTVVAVNGAAIAGGLFFVLGSDFRLAAPNARFGLAEVRVGADFPVGPLEIARATLDANLLRSMMLTGQPIDAEKALAAGIVDEIVAEKHLKSAAIAQAAEMATLPPQTFASVKRQIRGAVCDRIERAMADGGNTPEGGWFNDETVAAMKQMIG